MIFLRLRLFVYWRRVCDDGDFGYLTEYQRIIMITNRPDGDTLEINHVHVATIFI